MAWTHSRNTVIILGGKDISTYCNSSSLERAADSHDVTTYGVGGHVFNGGLFTGSASLGGVYDDTVNGPHDVIAPLIGTTVTLVRRPEGTGSGKPQETVSVVVTKYTETAPIADMVTWQADLQLSGTIADLNQP